MYAEHLQQKLKSYKAKSLNPQLSCDWLLDNKAEIIAEIHIILCCCLQWLSWHEANSVEQYGGYK